MDQPALASSLLEKNSNKLSKSDTDFDLVEDVDEALKELGGIGFHQKKIFMIILIMIAMGNYQIYPVSFFELQPQYICQFKNTEYSCSNIDFCPNLNDSITDSSKPTHKLNPDSDENLSNWISQYSLECCSSEEIGLIGTLFFVGLVIASAILPKLSDQYGRKPIVLIGSLLHVISSGICLYASDLKMLYASQFIMGFAMSGRYQVGYLFMTEHWAKKDFPVATGIFFAIDSLNLVVVSIFFKYISKDWRILGGVPTAMMLLAYIPLLMQNETPKFYFGLGKYEKARKVLTQIGLTNGTIAKGETYKKVFKKEIEERQKQIHDHLQTKKQAQSGPSLTEFSKGKNNVRNLICFVQMYVSVSFVAYLLVYYLKNIPGDIYEISITAGISEIIANFTCAYLLKCLSEKQALFLAFFISMISSFLIIFLEDKPSLMPIGVTGIKVGISAAFTYLYITVVLYFDSAYLGLAVGMCNFIGRLATLGSPMVAELQGVIPMMVSISLCILGLLATTLLSNRVKVNKQQKVQEN